MSFYPVMPSGVIPARSLSSKRFLLPSAQTVLISSADFLSFRGDPPTVSDDEVLQARRRAVADLSWEVLTAIEQGEDTPGVYTEEERDCEAGKYCSTVQTFQSTGGKTFTLVTEWPSPSPGEPREKHYAQRKEVVMFEDGDRFCEDPIIVAELGYLMDRLQGVAFNQPSNPKTLTLRQLRRLAPYTDLQSSLLTSVQQTLEDLRVDDPPLFLWFNPGGTLGYSRTQPNVQDFHRIARIKTWDPIPPYLVAQFKAGELVETLQNGHFFISPGYISPGKNFKLQGPWGAKITITIPETTH